MYYHNYHHKLRIQKTFPLQPNWLFFPQYDNITDEFQSSASNFNRPDNNNTLCKSPHSKHRRKKNLFTQFSPTMPAPCPTARATCLCLLWRIKCTRQPHRTSERYVRALCVHMHVYAILCYVLAVERSKFVRSCPFPYMYTPVSAVQIPTLHARSKCSNSDGALADGCGSKTLTTIECKQNRGKHLIVFEIIKLLYSMHRTKVIYIHLWKCLLIILWENAFVHNTQTRIELPRRCNAISSCEFYWSNIMSTMSPIDVSGFFEKVAVNHESNEIAMEDLDRKLQGRNVVPGEQIC